MPEQVPAEARAAGDVSAPAEASAADNEGGVVLPARDDAQDEGDDDAEGADEEVVVMADDELEDETTEEDEESDDSPVADDTSSGTIGIRLSTELRRRLRRRAEREGVQADELAEELLAAAIRRPSESIADLRARLEKLERQVTELAGQRGRVEPAAPAPRRFEDRPRGDFGGRGDAPSRGFGERPSYGGERPSYGGDQRGEERPHYGDRAAGSGGFRSERRFEDRPRGGFGDRDADRGGNRGFGRRDDRQDSRDRPPRRWEAPRRGE